MLRSRGRAALLGAALLFAGCSSCPGAPGEPGSRAGGTALGVKVPLPEGWIASASSEGALVLGPSGRMVLRIDLRPGAGEKLPTPSSLEEDFKRHLRNVRVSRVEQESGAELSLVILQLSAGAADAGLSSMALLGARRVGPDLYLCSTVPGSSPDDVKLAAGACRDIHLPDSP